MNKKNYYFIKLKNDLFNRESIFSDALEGLGEDPAKKYLIMIFYQKLMLKSLEAKETNGFIVSDKLITPKELKRLVGFSCSGFTEDLKLVDLAFKVLENLDLITISDKLIQVKHIKKYVSTSEEEFKQFFSVIENARDKLLFFILFYYRLRTEEVIGLKKKDFTSDYLLIRRAVTQKTQTKGQEIIDLKTKTSFRELAMSKALNELLRTYLNENKEIKANDFIFKSKNKTSLVISPNTIDRLKHRYSEKANIREITKHEFRHSCATMLISNCVSMELVSKWLGHSSSEVTRRVYIHILKNNGQEIANFIDKKAQKKAN